MKSDTQLHREILDEMSWDPRLRDSEIGVAVKGGIVTLSGTVSTYAKKLAAERAGERVSGGKAVADDLEVKFAGSPRRTDTEIKHAAVNALEWNTQVPDDTITLNVENGWITLHGDVPWRYHADAAERAVRFLTGVKGVTNMLRVMPSVVSTTEVRSKIEQALKRSAEIDSKRISVEAMDGKVTLRGTVRSWTERRDAESAAWSAPGVKQVEDHILVSA